MGINLEYTKRNADEEYQPPGNEDSVVKVSDIPSLDMSISVLSVFSKSPLDSRLIVSMLIDEHTMQLLSRDEQDWGYPLSEMYWSLATDSMDFMVKNDSLCEEAERDSWEWRSGTLEIREIIAKNAIGFSKIIFIID